MPRWRLTKLSPLCASNDWLFLVWQRLKHCIWWTTSAPSSLWTLSSKIRVKVRKGLICKLASFNCLLISRVCESMKVIHIWDFLFQWCTTIRRPISCAWVAKEDPVRQGPSFIKQRQMWPTCRGPSERSLGICTLPDQSPNQTPSQVIKIPPQMQLKVVL